MKIAFVQMNVAFGDVRTNLENAKRLINDITADLFVLPELFNSGYMFQSMDELASLAESASDGPTSQFLQRVATEKKCHLVAGLVERSGKTFFNSAVLVGPEGYVSTYRKVHLFNTEKKWFAPGDAPFFVVDIGPAKVGMMICFDWIFPESMRSLANLGADIVCHPANLVMPYCQRAMVTRCLENNVFAVTANRIGADERKGEIISFTGKSQITGPQGQVLASAPESSESVKVVEIDINSARDKWLNPRNNLLEDRRPDCYSL